MNCISELRASGLLGMIALCGCASPTLLRPINAQSEENLRNLSTNIQIVRETYLPVMSTYLDFKIQQLKVRKQSELLGGESKLTPDKQIQLEFYVRDQQDKKKEILGLLEELLTTVRNQAEISRVHLKGYKMFAESGKLADSLKKELQDSDFQLRALGLLKIDSEKGKRIQNLLSELSQ